MLTLIVSITLILNTLTIQGPAYSAVRLSCTLEVGNVLQCVEVAGTRELTLRVGGRPFTPWAEALKDLKPGVSTVDIAVDARRRRVCLVDTTELGGFEREAVNGFKPICVNAGRGGRRRRG